MDSYELQIDRFPGQLISGTPGWHSVGDIDDLTAYPGIDPFVTTTGASPLRRCLLGRGSVTTSDQGVQGVIDRLKPRRSGTTAIGFVLMWKTSGCNPDATFIDASESDESGVMGQFVCQPTIDEDLGKANHVRIQVQGNVLSIVERLENAETVLWQMTLNALHRRLALRAEHVDGTVTLWWNPDGIEEFRDAPVARVATLVDGSGLAGIFAHEDGRFLSVRVDYRVEQESQPPLLHSAELPAQDLGVVRLELETDPSRPPIMSGFLITPDRETRRPECQQRESRVLLRDARFFVTPGASHRAIAWYRDVDGNVIRADSKSLTLPGDEEDLRLRDDEGRLVLFDEEETPAGELRSRRQYLQWPKSIRDIQAVPLSGSMDAGASELGDWHDATPRGVRLAYTTPRQWSISLDAQSPVHKAELERFFKRCRARQLPALWSRPLTGEHVMVRFGKPALESKGVQFMTFDSSVDIVEDLWAFYVPTIEGSDSGSDSDESGGGGGIPPPPGDCVPGVAVCEVPMFSRPDAGYGGTLGLAYDRDPDRPALRAVDLALPDVIDLIFEPGEWSRDPAKPGPENLGALIGALQGAWALEYVGRADGKSRHWHHARYGGTEPSISWYMPPGGVDVVRNVWKGTREYAGNQLEVRFVAEYNPIIPDANGARGAIFHILAFTNQAVPGYVDGTAADDGITYTRNDPAVWGLDAVGLAFKKFGHPQLAVCACIPTTFQAPLGYDWYPGNQRSSEQVFDDPDHSAVSNDRAYCFRVSVGSPWSVPDVGIAYAELTTGPGAGSLDRLNAVGTAGFSKVTSRLQLVGLGQMSKAGALWHRQRRPVLSGFSTTFTFDVTDRAGAGGCGIAFVIQNQDPMAIGGSSASLGYGGITKSVAVEFDMLNDAPGDPDGNHISIHTNGSGANSADHAFSVGSATLAPSLRQMRTATVQYDSGQMRVSLDGVLILDVPVDLEAAVGTGEMAWVGFTASSGTGSQRTVLKSWTAEFDVDPTYGDPNDAIGNSVYGEGLAPEGYAALTMGAGCPASELYPWITIEDVDGISLLRAAHPGWNALQGGLDFSHPSSITLDACMPVQPIAYGCCDTVECVPPATEAEDFVDCCIPRLSRMDFDITQLRFDNTHAFDHDGNDHPANVLGQTYFRFVGLWVDEVHYSIVNPDQRSYVWKIILDDPDYVYRNRVDDFSSGTLDGWLTNGGSWSNTGSDAAVTGVSGVAILYSNSYDTSLEDATVACAPNGGASAVHAVALRASAFAGQGYFVAQDGSNQVLSIRKIDSDGMSVLAALAEMPYAPSTGLSGKAEGSRFTGSYGDDTVVAEDCEFEDGVFGLAAFTSASFASAQVVDASPATVTASATLDTNGLRFVVPQKAMPGYPDRDNCTGCNDCEGPFIDCDAVETESLWPGAIDGPPLDAPPAPLCGGSPPNNCPCKFETFVSLNATLNVGPWKNGYEQQCGTMPAKCKTWKYYTQATCGGF